MTHDGQGEALLRAILDEPDDDLPRLAYADWCDESDEPFAAAVIRGQLERPGEWYEYPGGSVIQTPGGIMTIPGGMRWRFRRGFVESVRCPLDAWRRHGPAVVRAHPVVRVELTDREPSPRPPTEVGWYRSSGRHEPEAGDTPAMLPASLFSRLTGGVLYDRSERGLFRARRIYGSEEGARDGLSDALLSWAKSPAALAQVT